MPRIVRKSPSRNSMISRTSRSNNLRNFLPEIYTLIDLPGVVERPSEGKLIKIKTSKKISYPHVEVGLSP